MSKMITFLGDDSGSDTNVWRHLTFHKGVPLLVDYDPIIEAASGNAAYKVEDIGAAPAAPAPADPAPAPVAPEPANP